MSHVVMIAKSPKYLTGVNDAMYELRRHLPIQKPEAQLTPLYSNEAELSERQQVNLPVFFRNGVRDE